MRKVTKEVVSAFIEGRSKRIDNTETDGVGLRLHGRTIAKWCMDGLWIRDAGWPTRTTHDRLRGLFRLIQHPAYVWTIRRKQTLSLNGEKGQPWDGSWTKVPCERERSIAHLALIASKEAA
jgi:hypothetical protein